MSFLNFVKTNLTTLPYFIGKPISLVPYSYRPSIGGIYHQRVSEILNVEQMTNDQKKSYVFDRVKAISTHAYSTVPFYKRFYKEHGVNPNSFTCFDDLIELPIITKSDLQNVSLEERSVYRKGRSIVNTGGSSGHPLEFYIEPNSVGHEWAHMHNIWAKLNFKHSDLKIVFGGRSNVKNFAQYDSARHQINIDLYAGWDNVASVLSKVYSKYKPIYLHGYPSSIFDFIIWLDTNRHPILKTLRENIQGLLLGSEFPSPQQRQLVEELLNCKSVSWYGHTERCVLAYEREEYGTYTPFLSYGYAEVVEGERLVSTSYYNQASPLIRYDTGDLIQPTVIDGLLASFKISGGRNGEFITDASGNKVFLTGLIFGRHHKLFELVRHIQIRQASQGEVEVLIVPRDSLSTIEAKSAFDGENVDIQFKFKIIDEPIRTPAGKVPLLVKSN